MSKMDGYASRTTTDLERRYNFGKNFSEVLGVALDAQAHAVEAEEIAKRIEAQVLNINVVDKLNVSAGTITLKSEGLSIVSKDFSLSAENGIKTVRGNIGLWDISTKGIVKSNDNMLVKIEAPATADEDFITVATLENGAVKDVPLCFKGNGNIYTKGIIKSLSDITKMVTIIDAGEISIDGPWVIQNEYQRFRLMKFIGPDKGEWGLFAEFYFKFNDETHVYDEFSFSRVMAERIT